MQSQTAKISNDRGAKARRAGRKRKEPSETSLKIVNVDCEEQPSVVDPIEQQTFFGPPLEESGAERPYDKAAKLFFEAMTEFELQSDEGLEQQIALLEEAAYLLSIDSGGSFEGSVNRVLGDLLMASGRFVEALVPLTRACALDEFFAELTPTCTSITNLGCSYFSLAEAQMQLDMNQKALVLYEQSASLLRRAIECSNGVVDVHNLVAIARIVEQARFEGSLAPLDSNSKTASFPGSCRSRTFVGVKKMLKIALDKCGVVS